MCDGIMDQIPKRSMLHIYKEKSMKGRVLVVDNEDSIRVFIGRVLKINNYYYEEADGFQSAQQKLSTNEYDVLLTDKNMPLAQKGDEGGMELIRWVRQHNPGLAVILMTGYPTVDSAIEALKLGAFDYLLKPLDPKLLMQKVERACEFRKCINSEAVMTAYLNLTRAVLDAAGPNAIENDERFAKLQVYLNHMVQNIRTVEHVLVDHRQCLAEIVAYAENSSEKLSAENPAIEMLHRIANIASQHI
jgi:DNA-binding response OmpR family regulator